MNGTIIKLDKVSKQFGPIRALDSVSAEINQGEFFSLLGPSGCGKTTLLRTIAGFEQPDSGSIQIDGQSMDGVEANRRPTNMVFQSYAIFPHMSIAENVGFGLRRKRLGKDELQRQVNDALHMVSLDGMGDRSATKLSGGQRQRVALARALIMRPKVLLLDEPLSALDKNLREQMQFELRHLQRAVGITFILVTHDQEEALTMSDRIAIMFDGRIAQLAAPEEIYARPCTRQVAEFIGSMNFLKADIIGNEDNSLSVNIEGLGVAKLPVEQTLNLQSNQVAAGVRPELLTILFEASDQSESEATGKVTGRTYYGDMTYYEVLLDGASTPVIVSMRNTAGRAILQEESRVRIGWDATTIILLQ